jgi:hypothetical protein
MVLRKNRIRLLALSSALIISFMVSLPFGQTCCLSTGSDSLASGLKAAGATNVTVAPGATCNYLKFSMTMPYGGSSVTATYTYQVVGADLQVTIQMTIQGQPINQTITEPKWCSAGAVHQGLYLKGGPALFCATPNPFTSEVSLAFSNPKKNAVLQVYNASGKIVDEIKNIKGSTMVYKPSSSIQGVFLVKVTTGDRVYSASVTRIK